MRRCAILIILAMALTSCATIQSQQTLGQVKKGLDCIECKEGMAWMQVRESFGGPDITPLPEPAGDLSRNTRIYQGITIIFYIDRQKVGTGEEAEFKEVVTKIEICKKKH